MHEVFQNTLYLTVPFHDRRKENIKSKECREINKRFAAAAINILYPYPTERWVWGRRET
jgi:hypothetical protein